MTGAWVAWSADVRLWPGVDDLRPNLDAAVASLCQQRDVVDAGHDYIPVTPTVTFHVLVRWGITEVVVKRQAIDALRAALPPAGLAMKNRDISPWTRAMLHFTWWPDSFQWW